MRYICMSFGWYQELLHETQIEGLAAAEAKLLDMLDQGAMIVHVYRETDAENPEIVGRHSRLRRFYSEGGDAVIAHEVERCSQNSANLDA